MGHSSPSRFGKQLYQDSAFKRFVWINSSLTLASLLVFMLLLPIPLIFAPKIDRPEPVDVILVLGPPEETRLDLAVSLIEKGYSSRLMISVSETDWPYSADAISLCTAELAYKVYCQQSEPFTTQGEIGWLTKASEYMNWDSAMVITFEPHVSRTRLYLDRCYGGDSLVISDGMMPRNFTGLAQQYFYQNAGFAKALVVTTDCV